MKDNDFHFGQGHMCAGCELAGRLHKGCRLDGWEGDASVGVYKLAEVDVVAQSTDVATDSLPLANVSES
ncbi:MAG: hypothetical protein UU93_C0010G0018 [Candidatus Amesbacteria bacterium GW2011_GWA2_42_12]|uniref:Uncharacterized protein n=1 Tax=Candidatus Amesbacteria bacterium GW2011_GWA2_42_12 TaxID=1618356 RepID=A0A0G0Y5U8_9BACT|nr:MAG: hypothetical protein UU93_C0010G0018 [Candidatus Amesbacteria bacterium GW2011_GWA2_42_12]